MNINSKDASKLSKEVYKLHKIKIKENVTESMDFLYRWFWAFLDNTLKYLVYFAVWFVSMLLILGAISGKADDDVGLLFSLLTEAGLNIGGVLIGITTVLLIIYLILRLGQYEPKEKL